MAFPILAIIILGSIIVCFAVFKDEILAIFKELLVDFVFGIAFTIVLDLLLPLTNLDILASVGIITGVVFLVHLLKAPMKQGMGQLSMH